jgi:hypothetical protein
MALNEADDLAHVSVVIAGESAAIGPQDPDDPPTARMTNALAIASPCFQPTCRLSGVDNQHSNSSADIFTTAVKALTVFSFAST